MRLKVAHLTSVHPPFDARIFHKECKTLAAAGHDVVLIVPTDADETPDGVRIRALPRPRGRLDRVMKTAWRLYRAALAERADVYHFHDPELIPVGILLALGGRKVIYDVHEDVPADIMVKPYLSLAVRRPLSALFAAAEAIGARFFAGIAAATPDIAARFPPAKTRLVQNFPRLEELEDFQGPPLTTRAPLAAYVGALHEVRGIRELVLAMQHLPAARLALAGNWTQPGLEAELRPLPAAERVEFRGWLGRQEVSRLLAEARVGLVTLWPLPTYQAAQPTKLYEYMAAGLPVVASDFPRWRELVDGVGCGLLVDPRDPQAIAAAIQWLLDHPAEAEAMGKRGAEAVRTRFHWAPEARELLALVESVGQA